MKRRNQRLAKVLIVAVGLALLAYVTLDTIYIHTFFSAENADVASLVLMVIVLTALFFELFIQRRAKPMQPSNSIL